MLKNYAKIAFRNLLKNRAYTIINLSGLTIGLSCVIIILAYVHLELSYDQFHSNRENLYRITMEWEDDGQHVHTAMNHAPLAEVFQNHLSAVDKITRIYPYPANFSIDRNEKYKENGFAFADSTFFQLFDFESLYPNIENALDDPTGIVLTESTALKYFGRTDVIGKPFYYEDEARTFVYTVNGVMKDIPQNSHMHFNMLGSFASLRTMMPWYNNWHHPPMYMYMLATEGYNEQAVEDQIKTIVHDHVPDYVQEEERKYDLQKVTDIHLYSDLDNEWQANSQAIYINMFIIIAGFILLIACVNFMNLSTARSNTRSKEVGLRKVFGAQRKQLIYQFLGESFLITTFSIFFAFGLTEWVLKFIFNTIVEQEISFGFLFSWPNWPIMIAAMFLLSFIAGAYPAFYLSRFRPVKTLKGKTEQNGQRVIGFRKGMVTFQFLISCLLILGTLIVLKQLNYLRNKTLGFDKEHIVALKMVDRASQTYYKLLKDRLLMESDVQAVSLSSTIPGREGEFYGVPVVPEGARDDQEYTIKTLGVDEDFLVNYNVELVSGRNFSEDLPTDQREAFVINEAAAKRFGWNDALGKELSITVYVEKEDVRKGKVIGVVKDFHFRSLYNTVEPLIIYINKHPYYSDFLSVKLKAGNIIESMEMLEKNWKDFNPNKPIEYYFLDQELDKLYHPESKRSQIFSSFAFLSIFISCLGLFGLSSFSAYQRMKEIGIRKVLGASAFSILKLLSKEYLLLIIIANLIAWPLTFYLSKDWLAGFAYKIDIGWDLYMITLFFALLIAFVTISFQLIKAALVNPVNLLKDE